MAVIGAADRIPVIARGRLNPDILESGLARDAPIGDAIERDAAGHAQILGAGRLAQPDGTLQQHRLGILLNLARQVFPMPHRGTRFPVALTIHQPRLVELDPPFGNAQLPVLHRQQRLYRAEAAIRRETHDLAALVPVGEDVARDPAVEGAEAGHVIELIAEKAAHRLEPDLLDRLEPSAFEAIITLCLAGERIDVFGQLPRLGDIGGVIAHAVHYHHGALLERTHGKGAVGVREMMRDCHHLVRARPVKRMLRSLGALGVVHDLRHVRGNHARFQVLDRQHVTVAHHQIDVLERDAFRGEAVVHDVLIETGGVFVAGYALLVDGNRERAVAQQARADIMVIGIYAEHVAVFFGHRNRSGRKALSIDPGLAVTCCGGLTPASAQTSLTCFCKTR